MVTRVMTSSDMFIVLGRAFWVHMCGMMQDSLSVGLRSGRSGYGQSSDVLCCVGASLRQR